MARSLAPKRVADIRSVQNGLHFALGQVLDKLAVSKRFVGIARICAI
jgi:hypothetical protein